MPKIETYVALIIKRGCDGPGLPKPGQLLVLMESYGPERAQFLCPCGCGCAVDLFVGPVDQRAAMPHWALTLKGNVPTLHPSVNHLTGCRSHYHIRAGSVAWA